MKKVLLFLTIAVITIQPFYQLSFAQEQTETLFPVQCGIVDALIPDSNVAYEVDFLATAWTFNSSPVTDRSLMQFVFASVPNNAIIDSAFLFLYWHPSTINIGHSTSSGSNACWLQRALSAWSSNTITWNNQPATTTVNEIPLSASTSNTQNYININLLPLVVDMINLGNYGFMMKLQTEVHYRSMLFSSSYTTDSSVMPRLRISYHINNSIHTNLGVEVLCAGSSLLVPYTTVGIFNTGNIFIAQLSDSSGAFIFPQNIGSISSTTSGVINAIIPQSTIAGTHYRIRVVATNPVTIGSDNGVNITINTSPIPVITASGNTAICQGDSVTLTSSVSANYLWNNFETTQHITVHSAGYYFVIITGSNGCTASSSMTIVTYLPNPVPIISANHSLILCVGDSVTLTSSHALNYTWNTNATNQSITTSLAGIYYVSVTDSNGCRGFSANIHVLIDIPPIPIITHSGTLLASSSATGNQWLMNNQIINGATNFIYTVTTTGCYSMMVTDSNGCTSISDTVCLEIRGSGIEEISNNNSIAIYPNPNDGNFTINNLGFGIYDLRIIDRLGRIVYSQRLIENATTINITEDLSNGIYFWELKSDKTTLSQGKLGIIK